MSSTLLPDEGKKSQMESVKQLYAICSLHSLCFQASHKMIESESAGKRGFFLLAGGLYLRRALTF